MKLSIGQRILAGFTVIILLTGMLGWYSLGQINRVSAINRFIAERDTQAMEQLLRVTWAQQMMRDARDRAWKQYLLRQAGIDVDGPEVAIQSWQRHRTETERLLEELAEMARSAAADAYDEGRRALWESMREKVDQAREILGSLTTEAQRDFDSFASNEIASHADRINSIGEHRREFTSAILDAQGITQSLIAEGRQDVSEIQEQGRWSVIVALIAVALLAIVTVLVLRQSIMRPLREFMDFVERVGDGDLTQRTRLTVGDEFGTLGRTLNEMVERLAEVAGQIRLANDKLASSASEIQAQAQQQAASTSEQNASIQQITSTMEEVSETGSQISERANKVASGAEAASSASRSGLDAAEQTGKAMVSIREQAEEVAENIVNLTEKTRSIGEIITTVNDIAERSNLLAFNASIEAAAAGEHGETFSVVAEEIKHLADQAKDATAQVRTLLGDIQQGISKAAMLTEEAVKRAESGESTSESTLATIRELVSNIEDSVRTFQQIVASTNQQQIGVEQVTDSVQSVREASEQLTGGTSQLEEAAGNLSTISEQLKRAVERYRL